MGKQTKLMVGAVTLVALVAIFIFLKPQKSSAPTHGANSKQPVTKTFNLKIEDGKLTEGSDTLKANKNDNIVINVTSNKANELHLHGYDKEVELEPGVEAKMQFKADQTGRFEIELHEPEQPVAALEVQP